MIWRQLRAIGAGPLMMTIVIPGLLLWLVGPVTVGTTWPAGVRVAFGVLAGAVLAVGVILFVWTVWLFAREGGGTLAPFDTARSLVVTGPYRHVRNPMYAGVFSVLAAEALAFRSLTVLAWFAVFATLVMILVPAKEERSLRDRYGAEYAEYQANVPRWVPRVPGWSPA